MSKNNEKKDDNGIVSGIILIVIGLIALLVTFFDVDIVWSELAKLWPVFIIVFGVSLLPLNKLLKSIMVVVCILLSFLLYYNGVKDDTNKEVLLYNSTYVDENLGIIQEFSEPYKSNITEANVEINYGAGTLHLNPPVAKLVKASNTSEYIIQDFSVKYEENKADIIFDVEDGININGKDVKSNNFYLALNEKPVYDFEVNFGASSMNFDFSDYKVSDIEINGGACGIDIKLGDFHDFTDVSINTGVSDVRVSVPSNSGCRVECETVFTNKDFKGLVKKSAGVYETTNYSSAKNIINIKFSGAISDFEIVRY